MAHFPITQCDAGWRVKENRTEGSRYEISYETDAMMEARGGLGGRSTGTIRIRTEK